MEVWMTALALIGILLAPVLLAGIANTYYGARYRLPFAYSSARAIQTMMDFGNVRQGTTILDLGSGAGDILLAAARKGARAHGLEINIFLVWLTRLRAWRAGHAGLISVERANMFTASLPPSNVVMLYLPSKKAFELRERLVAQMPRDALIISNGLSFPDWKEYKKENGVFTYKISDVRNVTERTPASLP